MCRHSNQLLLALHSVTVSVPLFQTRRMRRALAARGVPVCARYYPGEVHGFQALLFRRAAEQCWDDTFAFLKEHVPGEPRLAAS